jgi:hypothetical protein
MRIDQDVVAASPSSVYRVLSAAGLLDRWNKTKSRSATRSVASSSRVTASWWWARTARSAHRSAWTRAGNCRVLAWVSRLAAIRHLERTAVQLEAPALLGRSLERLGPPSSWVADGDQASTADRICLHLKNRTRRTLWLLAALGPVSSGVQIEPASLEILGRVPALGAVGMAVPWPQHVSRDRALRVELVALATTVPADLFSITHSEPAVTPAPRHSARGEVALVQPTRVSRHLQAEPAGDRAVAARLHFWLVPCGPATDIPDGSMERTEPPVFGAARSHPSRALGSHDARYDHGLGLWTPGHSPTRFT